MSASVPQLLKESFRAYAILDWKYIPCPPKTLWPIFIELFFVASIFLLKLLFHVISLVDDDMSPASVFFGTCPSDELEVSLVLMTVATFTMTIIPSS